MLARDLEALVYVHVPQLPSSRTCGSLAGGLARASTGARCRRIPTDTKIVPVPPRPFPSNLRDPDLLPEPRRPSDLPLLVWAAVALAVVAASSSGASGGCADPFPVRPAWGTLTIILYFDNIGNMKATNRLTQRPTR